MNITREIESIASAKKPLNRGLLTVIQHKVAVNPRVSAWNPRVWVVYPRVLPLNPKVLEVYPRVYNLRHVTTVSLHRPAHHKTSQHYRKKPSPGGLSTSRNNVCLLYSDKLHVRRQLTSDVSSPTSRVRRRPFSLHCEPVRPHASSAYQ